MSHYRGTFDTNQRCLFATVTKSAQWRCGSTYILTTHFSMIVYVRVTTSHAFPAVLNPKHVTPALHINAYKLPTLPWAHLASNVKASPESYLLPSLSTSTFYFSVRLLACSHSLSLSLSLTLFSLPTQRRCCHSTAGAHTLFALQPCTQKFGI